jgi:hypothetical protein
MGGEEGEDRGRYPILLVDFETKWVATATRLGAVRRDSPHDNPMPPDGILMAPIKVGVSRARSIKIYFDAVLSAREIILTDDNASEKGCMCAILPSFSRGSFWSY